jgi:hypothetical protein
MTKASQSCHYCISKGSRVARSRLLHGLLIGSAIVGLLFLM